MAKRNVSDKEKLARQISHIEGKKSQVKYGDILEVLTIIEKLSAKSWIDACQVNPTLALYPGMVKAYRKLIKEKG